ncbi:MAG: ABC transporter permease [Chloroflexi bacterium]|nr:ABC transporter permease [Chloroflexota bacterium]
MSVIWRKLLRDLWNAKTRTILVVLSTAVGLVGVGLVLALSQVTQARMTASHRAAHPAHLMFWNLGPPFDENICQPLLRVRNVARCETAVEFTFRWRRPGESRWRTGTLDAKHGYSHQDINVIDLLQGQWPTSHTLVVERQTARHEGLHVGETVEVEVHNRSRPLTIVGMVRDPLTFPPQFGGDPSFYADRDTAAWIKGEDGDNMLYIQLEHFSQEEAKRVADEIKARLQRDGIRLGGPWIMDPNRHFVQDQVDALVKILLALSVLALGLSVFLIINTMNAIVVQQIWQIGVMKVLGARTRHILLHYGGMVLVYSLVSVLLAIPLATIGAHVLAAYLLDFLNISVGPLRPVPRAVLAQLLTGLTVPLLAALFPIIGGLRVRVQEAIRTRGLGGYFGTSRLDRWLARIQRLPRPVALSLRNTFRKKLRISLTLLALVMGGVMFMMIMTVGTSLNKMLDDVLQEVGGDVWIVVERPYRVSRLLDIAYADPRVEYAEVWQLVGASLHLPGGGKRSIRLRGIPPDSRLFHVKLAEGRYFLPGDRWAILMNQKVAREEGIQVGDVITTTVDGREVTWTVVGLVYSIMDNSRGCFVPMSTLNRALGTPGRGNRVSLVVRDKRTQEAVSQDVRRAYERRGIKIQFTITTHKLQEMGRNQFNVFIYTLLSMSILAALVGGLGLMGTLSINVVERQREIGVLRAIGAHNRALLSIFVIEGLVIGMLSWLIAVPLTIPLSWGFTQFVANIMSLPIVFLFSWKAVGEWAGLVFVLSALASLGPAWQALRLSVREVLAYE